MTAMSTDREHDLVVLGATGFVGRLLAAYLARHAPCRSPSRSRRSLAGAAGAGPSRSARRWSQTWPLVVCDATDAAQVEALARSTRVVVTTVGPYARYGLPLVRACAEAGTHYADLTGEVLFVRDAVDAAHETAVRTGARMVTSCGFDSIPSDLGVHLLYHEAERLGLGGLGDTTLLVTQLSGGFSGGTIDSMRAQMEALEADPSRRKWCSTRSPSARTAAPNRTAPVSATRCTSSATPPPGGGPRPWVMASFNSRIVRRSDSLLEHAYGSRFRYREAMGFGRGTQDRLQAYAWPPASGTALPPCRTGTRGPWPTACCRRPARAPTRRRARRVTSASSCGPPRPPVGGLLAVVAAKGDPGYAATAVMLGESALCLAGPDGWTRPGEC